MMVANTSMTIKASLLSGGFRKCGYQNWKHSRITQSWYGNSSHGIRGISNRVILNGGLTPIHDRRISKSDLKINAVSIENGKKDTITPTFSLVEGSGKCFSTYNSRKGIGRSNNISPSSQEELYQLNGGHQRPFLFRNQLKAAKRVVIKLGSAVVAREDGNGLALGRLASIVEQIAELQNKGHECILVSSGAIAYGKQLLSQELMMGTSMRDTLKSQHNMKEEIRNIMVSGYKKPNAAVGQSGMQALYETMFRNYGIIVAQVLVTKPDFYNKETCKELFQTISELLQLNIIPIINTNDAVTGILSTNDGSIESDGKIPITDNDALAARISVEIGADLSIMMSDIDGVYKKPPNSKDDDNRILYTFIPSDLEMVKFGEKSNVGTGGMESKVRSAMWAVEHGTSVVICNGTKNTRNNIRKVIAGDRIGTFFSLDTLENFGQPVEVLAQRARTGSRTLQLLCPSERATVISTIADDLIKRKNEILAINQLDLDKATADGIKGPMYDRLVLTSSKLESLAKGIHQIAENSHENVGRTLRRTKISDTLSLVQKTVPIGVLMVIFESRPDVLPQVASLAIASANGLLLKGGSEATNSNGIMLSIVKSALEKFDCADAISMVSTREAIGDLLNMENSNIIDLIIPRGSGELVKSIKQQSKMIPVLGHADGVCHVYVDQYADPQKTTDIIVDSKTDYPAACNAAETLLFHKECLNNGLLGVAIKNLKARGVELYSGPNLASEMTFAPPETNNLKLEYGDMACTVELVSSVNDAIDHIHQYGSSHTDVIITEDKETMEKFLKSVDSACVFANCSSRMSDGYRLGLGAEVGISTGRIHARGPVGVEGLLTTKWVLEGDGDTAEQYATGKRMFIHQQLPVLEDGALKE